MALGFSHLGASESVLILEDDQKDGGLRQGAPHSPTE